MAAREKTRFCLIQIRHSLHYTYVDLACLDGYCAYSLVGKPGQKYAPISKHMSLILRYARPAPMVLHSSVMHRFLCTKGLGMRLGTYQNTTENEALLHKVSAPTALAIVK